MSGATPKPLGNPTQTSSLRLAPGFEAYPPPEATFSWDKARQPPVAVNALQPWLEVDKFSIWQINERPRNKSDPRSMVPTRTGFTQSLRMRTWTSSNSTPSSGADRGCT